MSLQTKFTVCVALVLCGLSGMGGWWWCHQEQADLLAAVTPHHWLAPAAAPRPAAVAQPGGRFRFRGNVAPLPPRDPWEDPQETLVRNVVLGAAASCVVTLLAVSVCAKLLVGRPIQRLGERMRRVAETQAYADALPEAARADETGTCARAFNRLLEVVRANLDDLRHVNETLEKRVAERTSELSRKAAELEEQARETARNNAELQAVRESALDCIVTMDHTGRVTEFNPAAERTFGYARAEAVGRTLHELIVPSRFHAAHEAGLRGYLEGGHGPVLNKRIEVVARRADGVEFPVEMAVTPVKRDGPPVFVGYLRDITDRKAAEAAAQAAQKLALVARYTENAVVITDPSGLVEWVNEGFTRITGYSADEVVGKKPGSFLQGPETDPATVEMIRRHVRAGEGCRTEIVNYAKDGRKYWLSIDLQPIRDAAGKLDHFIAIESDVSDRKRDDERLRRTTQRLQTLINASPLAIFTFDPEGVVQNWNAAAEKIFGWSADEVCGRPIPIVPDGRREEFDDLRGRLMAGGAFTNVETVRRAKDGRLIDVSISAAPLPDRDGRVREMVAVLADVTERKASEAALRRAEEKYRGLFENAVHGIFQTTPAGQYLSVNPALRAHLRVRRRRGPQGRRQGHFPAVVRGRRQAGRVPPAGRGERVRRRVRGADLPQGRVGPVDQRAGAGRPAPSGEIQYYEGTVEDVDERKRTEQRLQAQYAVTRVLADAATVDEALPYLVEALGKVMGWAAGGFWRPDPEAGVLRSAVRWRTEAVSRCFDEAARGATHAPGDGNPGAAWAGRARCGTRTSRPGKAPAPWRRPPRGSRPPSRSPSSAGTTWSASSSCSASCRCGPTSRCSRCSTCWAGRSGSSSTASRPRPTSSTPRTPPSPTPPPPRSPTSPRANSWPT